MSAKDFIEAAFNKAGITNPFNQWITLDKIFTSIGIHKADNNIAVSYKTKMFYFNEADQMIYIRRFTGIVYPYDSSVKLDTGDITFTVDGNTYYLKCYKNYKMSSDNNIGAYHEAVSFDQPTLFSYINNGARFRL